MKLEQKNAARELRCAGWSVNRIAKELEVSKSSVSLWVKDVILSGAARDYLESHTRRNVLAIAEKQRERYRAQRRLWQAAGREKAKDKSWLHIAGCMLYWAEGTKGANAVDFTNADPKMVRVFKQFLDQYFDLSDSDYRVQLNFYTDIHVEKEIENYWLDVLSLPRGCLRKNQVNNQPKQSANQKAGTLEYGVCKLRVNKTAVLQHIYGAIQEYIGFDRPEWLR